MDGTNLRMLIRTASILALAAILSTICVVGAESDADSDGGWYYDQLDPLGKIIYEVARSEADLAVPSDLPEPYSSMAFNELCTFIDACKDDVIQALECEWVLGNHGNGELMISIGSYGENNFISARCVHSSLFDDDEAEDEALTAALMDIQVDKGSRLATVTSIHDAVCEMLDYDYHPQPEKSYSLHNAVLGDHIVVCEGYAKTFLALCQLHGIPCIGVSGVVSTQTGVGGHMYNMVQMDDGKWYAVDATWDDQDGWTADTYLLAGSNTIGFHGVSFKDSHHPTGLLAPPLASDTYMPGVMFSFDGEVLRFSGEGDISDGTDAPWSQYKDAAKSIVIGEGIGSIGSNAFYRFSGVKSVSIGPGVESIGSKAFSYCSSLTSLEIPGTVKSIGAYAFYKGGIGKLVLGDGVESIGAKAFQRCPLKHVRMASTVTDIGAGAFAGCSFYDADGKTALEAEPSLLAGYTFKGSPSALTLSTKFVVGFTFTKGQLKYTVTSSLSKDRQLAVTGYEGSPVDLEIPTEVSTTAGFFPVTSVGTKAFYGCGTLKTLDLGNVASIGAKAFARCPSLTSLAVDEPVKTISSYAFYGCASLTSLSISGDGTVVDVSAFSECKNLKAVSFGGSGISVGTNSFYNCTSLSSLDLTGVKTIGTKAFPYCNGMEELVIPGTVKSVGPYAFYKCSSLASITVLDGVKSIGKSAFSGCGKIVRIEIGQSVQSIGQNAFHGYTFIDAGGDPLNADASSLAGHLFQGAGKILRLET